MKSACVGVLSIIELKNARWNIEIIAASFVLLYLLKWVISKDRIRKN